MTVSEEFIAFEDGAEEAPNYPTAFGITFTPTISGILIAVAGLAASVYLFLNLLSPALQKNQELTANQSQKQSQVAQKAAGLKQLQQVEADLARAKQQKAEVLSLFSNQQTLATLLLDINRLVESTNNQRNTSAKLTKFVPANQSAEIISDSSLGPEVNNKLKRLTIEIELEGTFEQTQSILRNIERLQPLLLVKDYESKIEPPSSDQKERPVAKSPTLTTSFKLQALIPLSPEEIPPPAQEQKK